MEQLELDAQRGQLVADVQALVDALDDIEKTLVCKA